MKKIASVLTIMALLLVIGVSTVLSQSETPTHNLVIRVKKSANPQAVYEPGGAVNFTVTIANTGTVAVTLTSLVDDIHGDLNGQGTCSVPQTLPAGWIYTCTFPAMVNGNAGYSETNTITASGTDENGTPVEGSGSTTVVVLNVPPVIAVTKTPDPASVPEPGGEVTFTVTITNNSVITDPVVIDSLVDDIHGDLNGQGTCAVPQTLQPGDSYTCHFSATVSGNAGYSETDTVTASGHDDENTPTSAEAKATVTVTNVPPVIAVTKTPDPATVPEPGGMVTYTVSVTNHSVSTDPVTINSLVDDIYGDLNGQGTCSVPQTLQPGDSYTCHFQGNVQGTAGQSVTDTVTASGVDDEQTPVSAHASATVDIVAGLYKIFLPVVFNSQQTECGLLKNWGTTVGFEDLLTNIDYDYNDWVTSIQGTLNYNVFPDCELNTVNFVINPEAHGARYDHAFHLRIPANVFGSNGTATLTIFDTNHNVLSTTTSPFTAAADNDYLIFPHTADVFPTYMNTTEGQPFVPPTMTAELVINFSTPIAFDPANYDLTQPHGVGMFFDPYLYVIPTGEAIHIGDMKLLNVPIHDWLWPEERHAIFQAYPLVVYVPGPPVQLIFPAEWWTVHNPCVYGDGIVCPLVTFDLAK